MKAFHCDGCGGLVFFENNVCMSCGLALGFLPDELDLSALKPREGDLWESLSAARPGGLFRMCGNSIDHGVCNWLIPADSPDAFCVSCRLNEMIPDLKVAGNRERWLRLELAKRRLIYTLLKLHLPVVAQADFPALRFRFLGESAGGKVVLTGHNEGCITMNIAEADDDVREQRRVNLHEPFRTLLGHFRHEIAHYYWDRLIAGTPRLERFREAFGDERADYDAALQLHYRSGPPADWAARSVSAYASAHPWEDWAETWAHYLHIVDTIETAASFGLRLKPRDHPAADSMTADPKAAAHEEAGFDLLLSTWFPLTYALNSLNRGMGLPDLYPFVLSGNALGKLRLVHEIIEEMRMPERTDALAGKRE
ncbi:MAG TPA: putative zinc-binding metallopeptidase [Lacunisphaera sp.]|nr:putative zinc-binding metallopeptidase [Lacunisphaera sp.]